MGQYVLTSILTSMLTGILSSILTSMAVSAAALGRAKGMPRRAPRPPAASLGRGRGGRRQEADRFSQKTGKNRYYYYAVLFQYRSVCRVFCIIRICIVLFILQYFLLLNPGRPPSQLLGSPRAEPRRAKAAARVAAAGRATPTGSVA